MHAQWLRPDGLGSRVGALMSTRHGGFSGTPWQSMNLGAAVGDDADTVARNRSEFARAIGAAPVYLKQVHGTHLVQVTARDAAPNAPLHEADASLCTEPGVACAVLVADCLPVLLAAPRGRAVAAAHAGWRGLAAGVVGASLLGVCEAASCEPREVRAWLGACIGPRRFEVGADVLRAFGVDPRAGDERRFVARGPGHAGKWLADLAGLARDRLLAAGVTAVGGGHWCSVEDASSFFSFRRDGVTGRMAAAIWIRR